MRMMNKQDWKQAFPAVPEEIHSMIVDTLNQLEERTPKKRHSCSKKKVFLLAAALTLTLSTAVAAAELIRWSEPASQVFQADEIMQNRLETEGISQQLAMSVTDQGITIKALQTVQDQNFFYALFEVIAEDETMLLTEHHAMNLSVQPLQGHEEVFSYLTWGFVDTLQQPEVSSHRYFEIRGTKFDTSSNEPLKLIVAFQELLEQTANAGTGNHLVSGDWTFQLEVNQTQPKILDLNKTIILEGQDARIKQVELTPLTLTLICDGKMVKEMEHALQLRLDQADTLYPLQVTGIVYRDGTILDQIGFGGLTEGYSAETGDYIKTQRLTTVVDLTQVRAILLGEEKVELMLY